MAKVLGIHWINMKGMIISYSRKTGYWSYQRMQSEDILSDTGKTHCSAPLPGSSMIILTEGSLEASSVLPPGGCLSWATAGERPGRRPNYLSPSLMLSWSKPPTQAGVPLDSTTFSMVREPPHTHTHTHTHSQDSPQAHPTHQQCWMKEIEEPQEEEDVHHSPPAGSSFCVSPYSVSPPWRGGRTDEGQKKVPVAAWGIAVNSNESMNNRRGQLGESTHSISEAIQTCPSLWGMIHSSPA